MTDYAAELAAEPVTDLDLDTIEAQARAEIAGVSAKWLAELRNQDRLRLCREVRELREQRDEARELAAELGWQLLQFLDEPFTMKHPGEPAWDWRETIKGWAEGGE